MSANTMDHVLIYNQAKLCTFPCRERGKEPLTEHGYLDASDDPEQNASWWRRWANANVGLALPPWLTVVDRDAPDALARLHAGDYFLPATLTCHTKRGAHGYYRLPPDVTSRCCAGPVSGVDLKGFGGYTLVPPSVHPSGATYTWEGGRFDPDLIADAPDWLVALLGSRSDAKSATAPEEWRELIAGVEAGRRNAVIARLTGHLLRRHVDPVMTLGLVRSWNITSCRPPLDDSEVLRAIDSIAAAELRRRRGSR